MRWLLRIECWVLRKHRPPVADVTKPRPAEVRCLRCKELLEEEPRDD